MIYVVKNVSEYDRNNSLNPFSVSSSSDKESFDVLKYDGYYEFDGSEDYSKLITEEDFDIVKYSPLFFDWSGTADPQKYRGAHYTVRKFIRNDQKYCSEVMSGGLQILLKTIFGANEEVRFSFYEGVLKPFVNCLTIGDIMSAKFFIESKNAQDLFNESEGYGSVELWNVMKIQALTSIQEHLMKFPRY